MAEKRYFWLRLQHDFFQSKRIKKLRKLAGGDTYTIIYLKMQLKAIMNDGVLTYTGIEPTFAEELALDIDEEPDNVLVTVNYLLSCGLMETADNKDFVLPYAIENTGAADSSAERVRRFRERQKQLALSSNVTVTDCNVTSVTSCNGESEKEKEKELYIQSDNRLYVSPSLPEIESFARERNSPVDPKRFFTHYEGTNWTDKKGKPIRDWKKQFMAWEAYERKQKPTDRKFPDFDDGKADEQLDRLLRKMEGGNAGK